LKAVVYTEYGGPDVLQIKELPRPEPQDNEVLVKVHAVSINDWDWGLLQSDFVNRLMFLNLLNRSSALISPDVLNRLVKVLRSSSRVMRCSEI
jgi:hypothetical protein